MIAFFKLQGCMTIGIEGKTGKVACLITFG